MKQFIPLILAFSSVVALGAGYAIMSAQVAAGIARASGALTRAESLAERDALIRSQQRLLEESTETRAAIDTFVAAEDNVVGVIERIEDTARTEGVALVISTVNTVPGDGWQYHEGIEVVFSVAGSFRQMTQFIAALEALPVAVELSRASLEVADGGWFGVFTTVFVKKK